MNNKTLYIHIGTQKTGTTTIQSILSKNKKKLLDEGIGYLGRFAISAREMRVINQPDPVLERELQEQVKAEIDALKRFNCSTYIISNEKFTGDKMIAYRNTGLIAQSLKRIFEPFQFDIKIIVFIRRQDKFIESTYAQKVYSGSSLAFQEFLDHFDKSDFHWDQLLDSYADVFGKENILVRGFDKKYLPQKNSLIHTFGEAVGSSLLGNYAGENVRNRGYSRDSLEIARMLNKYLEKKERRKIRDILREAGPKKSSYSFFSNREREKFLANYEKSNRKVAREYFNLQNESLFTPQQNSSDSEEERYEGLTTEAVAVILSKSLLILNDDINEQIAKQQSTNIPDRIIRKLKRVYRKVF